MKSMVASKPGRDQRASEWRAISKALRLLRTQRGWKQFEVANAANLTKAQLSNYETGTTCPSLPSLLTILGALGADFRDLQMAIDAVSGLLGVTIKGTGLDNMPGERDASGTFPKGLPTTQRELVKAVLVIANFLQSLGRPVDEPLVGDEECGMIGEDRNL
jgi:transcriptional regulator with XRE-family HTH domain